MIDSSEVDGVHVIRMTDGENRLGLGFVTALHEALDEVEGSGGPVVLTGDGKYFSNGLDLDWMSGAARPDLVACMDGIHRLFARLLVFPAATVAAVNGHAFGAGAMLAAAPDVRIMREDRGYVCFPEIDLGMPMAPQMTALLRSRYAPPTLLEAWTTGGRYGGPDALALGLVDALAGEDDLVDAAVDRVRPLVGKDGATMQSLKRSLYGDAVAVIEGGADPEGGTTP